MVLFLSICNFSNNFLYGHPKRALRSLRANPRSLGLSGFKKTVPGILETV